jgi:hypothetical protein
MEGPSEHENSSAIPTAGEIFPDGAAIELLRNAADKEHLNLIICRNGILDIKSEIRYANRVYVPMPIDPSVANAVRFPTRVAPSESTRKLFTAVHALLASHLGQLDPCVTAIVFAIFASWLSPVLPMAPILSIFAPTGSPKKLVLLLLKMLCRHPLCLVGLRRSDLLRVPMLLQPSLLLDEPDSNPTMEAILNASSQRGTHITCGRGVLNLFGPKIIVSSKPHLETDALRTALIPTAGNLPPLDKRTVEEIAEEFQARFLGYLLRNAGSAQTPGFDVSQFSLPVRDIALGFGAAVVDNELQARILPLLSVQDEEIRSDRALTIDAVVLEALVSFIHEARCSKLRTTSIAGRVSAIYQGRGSDQQPSAESVGRTIKRLGIPSGRIERAGNGVDLSELTCRTIHKLAQSHGVRAMETGLPSSCRYCRELTAMVQVAKD